MIRKLDNQSESLISTCKILSPFYEYIIYVVIQGPSEQTHVFQNNTTLKVISVK